MKIISLELENIKSYKHEIINFKNGINCILGLNGSGKSTIIESIGFGLFNYSPKTMNELLRYNEIKGLITITFEAIDGKIYCIKRTIKSKSNTVKIIDMETNQVLYENVSDVYEFVRGTLNIPKEKSLPKLFEEIIAVPQGTFVNAFLETSKNRKENFDKLFDLDIYKMLADNMKKLNDIVEKEHLFNLEKSKERLLGELVNFETKKEEQESLIKEINDRTEVLNELNHEKVEKEIKKEFYENQKRVINNLNNDLVDINSQAQVLKVQLDTIDKQIFQMQVAKKQLINDEYGYNMYISSTNQLNELERKLHEHNKLKEEHNYNQNQIELNDVKIENIKDIIHNKKIDLGKNKQTEIDLTKSIVDCEEKAKNIEITLKDLKSKQIIESENEIQISHRNHSNLEYLNGVKDTLLGFHKEDTNVLQEKLAIIHEKQETINRYKQLINNKQINIEKLNNEIENLEANKSYMKDGLCPILHAKCLNIENTTLNEQLEKEIVIKKHQISQLLNDIHEMTPLVNKEEELSSDRSTFELTLMQAQNDENRFNEIIEEIKKRYNVEINNENYLDIVSNLISQVDVIIKEYKNETLDNLNNKINQLQSDKISALSHISINKNTLIEIRKTITNIELEIEKNNTKLEELLKNNERFETLNKQLKLKLKPNESIEIEIDEKKQLIKKFEPTYNSYILNKDKCKDLDDYMAKQEDLSKQIDIINEKQKIITIQIEEEKQKYNEDIYITILKEVEKINNEIVSTTSFLNIKQDIYNTLHKEIDILQLKHEELKNKEKEINIYQRVSEKLKMYRDIFINIPKELSIQIRNYISIYATALYQMISSENVRVEMLDDYEVELIDMSDANKVKSIKQLSGGEQMSVAIAIRLAMLKQITKLDFYFLDEPTINLDYDRRVKVGEVVKDISKELSQLFVISHDDTFDNITDNSIKIIKINNESNLSES